MVVASLDVVELGLGQVRASAGYEVMNAFRRVELTPCGLPNSLESSMLLSSPPRRFGEHNRSMPMRGASELYSPGGR